MTILITILIVLLLASTTPGRMLLLVGANVIAFGLWVALLAGLILLTYAALVNIF